jgi:hypothetical protein
MREERLGKVLLVKAVEECDRSGELLPLADREHATRDVLRAMEGGAGTLPPGARDARVLGLLAERADRLYGPLAARLPVLSELLERSRIPGWATWLMLGVALASGIGLASLDGSRRINILAFPFLGVIAWNLAVYVSVGVLAARRWAGSAPAAPARGWSASAITRRLSGLVARTSRVHARLGEVVGRYAADWAQVGAPLFAAHARRLLHLGAATLAVGLIAGLYLRGVVFRYEAGWESTFLGPRGVSAILGLVFGPASALTGIALPRTDEAVAALRWTASGGDGDAAPWIHLIAVTLGLYVVGPRLLLAFLARVDAWRWARVSALPAALVGYARATLGAAQFGRGGEFVVVPYAHEPGEGSRAALARWLESEFGRGASADVRPMVRYGDEAGIRAALEGPAGGTGDVVLLLSLAATPESENHGLAIAAARDAAAAARPSRALRVVVDEAPLLARFEGDASLAGRIEERRRLWREFVRGYGLDAAFAELRAA